MKASLKRIIWGLGWYTVYMIDSNWSYSLGAEAPTNGAIIVFLLVWILPLLAFKDDAEGKKK